MKTLTSILFPNIRTEVAYFKFSGVGISVPRLGMPETFDVVLEGKDLVELANRIRPGLGEPKIGKGTLDEPWQMNSIREWFYCSTKKSSNIETWFKIGGRLIRRLEENQYVSDWGEANSLLDDDRKRNDSMFSDEHGPSYPQIYKGLVEENLLTKGAAGNKNDQDLAAKIRKLLAGEEEMEIAKSKVLPVLCAAWFLSEVNRNPRSLLIGLMILDLIEAGLIQFPDCQEAFSFMAVLWHPSKFLSEESKKVNTPLGSKDADNWGGHHPMAHNGSFTETAQEDWKGKPSVVQLKEADIIIRWLILNLKHFDPRPYEVGAEKLNMAPPVFHSARLASKSYIKARETLKKRHSNSSLKTVWKKAPLFFVDQFAQKNVAPLMALRLLKLDRLP